MKIVALGDIHGRTIWKEITQKELGSDKIVFIGDYFDSRDDISAEEQLSNFKEIIEFKKNNMNKVILLIGNHSYHYLSGIPYGEVYSGFQYGAAPAINQVLMEALGENLLQMCYVNDKYLFSHAGVTKTWATNHGIDVNLRGQDLEDAINELFKTKIRAFGFQMGDNHSGSGNDITQPPIWVRPQSLITDMLDDITCVVGHTTVHNLGINLQFPNIILIDCLGTSGEYLIVENNIPRIGK